MRRWKPSPTTAIAIAALFVGLGGTALAASRYIITSTSQIKPSVLRELRAGAAHAAEVKLAASGAHGIVARAKLSAPMALEEHHAQSVSLAGATWTQHAEETQAIAGGFFTVTMPSQTCEQMRVDVFSTVDKRTSALTTVHVSAGQTVTTELVGFAAYENGWLPEPPAMTKHAITVQARASECMVEHVTTEAVPFKVQLEALRIAVLGLK
jgi:hypothetical protein